MIPTCRLAARVCHIPIHHQLQSQGHKAASQFNYVQFPDGIREAKALGVAKVRNMDVLYHCGKKKGEHEQPCEARLSKDERLGFGANENVDLDLGENPVTNSQ